MFSSRDKYDAVISRRRLVTKFAVVEGDDAEPDVKVLQGYPVRDWRSRGVSPV